MYHFSKKFSFLLIFLFCTACFVGHAAEPDWNQFRGPNHDNMAFSTDLLKTWPEGGPKLLQEIEGLGDGYSNLSFDAKRIYTLGDIGDSCLVTALDRKTGKKLWSTPIGKSGQVGRYYGPRATPATDGKTVFAFSQFGDFASLDAETGKLNWCKNVSADFGGKYMNQWGYASSPILEGDLVVLQIGGEKGTLAAFSRDGKIVWRSAELKEDASYATVVPAEIDGVRQFLLFTPAASPESTRKMENSSGTANAPVPVPSAVTRFIKTTWFTSLPVINTDVTAFASPKREPRSR